MKAQNLNRMTPYVFMAPAAIIMGLALLYPLAYMIYGSVSYTHLTLPTSDQV